MRQLVVLVASLFMCAPAVADPPSGLLTNQSMDAKSTCGDLDDNGWIDFNDYLYLINYMFYDGPPPIGDADMDECGSVNMGDAW